MDLGGLDPLMVCIYVVSYFLLVLLSPLCAGIDVADYNFVVDRIHSMPPSPMTEYSMPKT